MNAIETTIALATIAVLLAFLAVASKLLDLWRRPKASYTMLPPWELPITKEMLDHLKAVNPKEHARLMESGVDVDTYLANVIKDELGVEVVK